MRKWSDYVGNHIQWYSSKGSGPFTGKLVGVEGGYLFIEDDKCTHAQPLSESFNITLTAPLK